MSAIKMGHGPDIELIESKSPLRTVEGWIRFDDYEIFEGNIRPVRGCGYEVYDPWTPPDNFGPINANANDLCTDFLNLSRRLKKIRQAGATKTDIEQQEIECVLQWCRGNGLLGLLPEKILSVNFQPTVLSSVNAQGKHPVVQLNWRFAQSVWVGTAKMLDHLDHMPLEGEKIGLEVDATFNSVVRDIWSGEMRCLEPFELDALFSNYFPNFKSSPKQHVALPALLEFWEEYSEPVDEFIEQAIFFGDVMAKETSTLGYDRKDESRLSYSQLNSLTAYISPLVIFDSFGQAELHWSSRSLLANYGYMAMQDLTKDRPEIRICIICQTFFNSRSYQGKYCSQRCRNTAQKRAYRARKKEGQSTQ